MKKVAHFEVRSVVLVETLKRFDEQEGSSEPDRSTPVRVSSKHGRVRISRPVVNAELFSVDIHRPGVFLVITREPERRIGT